MTAVTVVISLMIMTVVMRSMIAGLREAGTSSRRISGDLHRRGIAGDAAPLDLTDAKPERAEADTAKRRGHLVRVRAEMQQRAEQHVGAHAGRAIEVEGLNDHRVLLTPSIMDA
jgi:hypothetical protein